MSDDPNQSSSQARAQLAEIQKAIDSLNRLLNKPAGSASAKAAPQK